MKTKANYQNPISVQVPINWFQASIVSVNTIKVPTHCQNNFSTTFPTLPWTVNSLTVYWKFQFLFIFNTVGKRLKERENRSRQAKQRGKLRVLPVDRLSHNHSRFAQTVKHCFPLLLNFSHLLLTPALWYSFFFFSTFFSDVYSCFDNGYHLLLLLLLLLLMMAPTTVAERSSTGCTIPWWCYRAKSI